MPHKLKRLKIDRVDLVDKGANPDAHIVLFKRDNVEKAHTLKEILDMQEQQEEAYEEKWKIMDAFMASLKSTCEMTDDDERMRVAMESTRQFIDMMKPIHDVLQEGEGIYMSDELKKQLDDMTQKRDEALKRATEAEEALAKRDEPEPEDIWKGVPPAIRKMYEDQEARLVKSEAIAKAERDERQKQEAIRKAASYSHLPVNADDDWQVFQEIETNLSPAISKRVYELFGAGNTNIAKSGIDRELGTEGNPNHVAKSAMDETDQLIRAEMAKSDISYDQAYSRVLDARPDLYHTTKRNVQGRV